MAYSKFNPVTQGEINNFIGPKSQSTAYASSAEATQKIAAIYGVGYGDRGYGQSAISLAPIAQYSPAKATEWNALRNAIASIASHQGTAQALLPPVASGYNPLVAHDGSGTYNLASMVSSVDTNRFNTNSGASMTLYSSQLTVTRAASWNATITCEVQADFASEDAARYFFNTGGEIRIALAQPTGTAQSNSWNSVLSGVGTIAFKANTTTRSGAIGTPQAIGYYQLTTSNQLIFDGSNIGSGAYSTNDVLVYARAQTITGLNGAKGYQIRFVITLQDQHTNAYFDTVAAGANAVFSVLKSTAVMTGITTPTFSTITAF